MVNDDVKIIVLRTDRGEGKPNADCGLFGRTLEEWVVGAMRGMDTVSADYAEGGDLLPVVRPILDMSRPITAVLYSDTPLITYSAINECLNRFRGDVIGALKLPRGWIFSTAYLSSCEKAQADKVIALGDEDFITVFNYNQLAYASDILRSRINYYHMNAGVELVDPAAVLIDAYAVIEPGAKIGPYTEIRGKSIIRAGAEIGAHCVITSSVVESGAKVRSSTLDGALVSRGAEVGPYAYLRPGSRIGAGAKIGDHVEIKNSRIGAGTKVCQLAYVGDADIGEDCNIGAGTVFANYDGAAKHRTVLGKKVFVGSNSTLVAPLDIGSGAFIAAGSVITTDVPERALAIRRAPAAVKEDWQKNAYTRDAKDNRTAPGGANSEG